MLRYVAKRVVYMFVALLIIISLTWFISKLLPGTPFADQKLTPESRAQLFDKYGLDEPWPVQYGKYMLNVAQGDLGNSYYFQSKPVTEIILARLPVSAFVGIQAIVIGLVIGLVLGIVAALRHNSFWDSAATVVAILGVSVPSFVLGPILQYWLGLKLGWFPIAFFESWWHSILPSLALSVFVTASLWCVNIGHGHEEVVRAVAEQMRRLDSYSTFGDYANEPALELSDRLSRSAPVPDARVFLTSGGGDSIDTAAKLACQYWSIRGANERVHLIGRDNGYHGTHGYGTSLGGIEANRVGWGPLMGDVSVVPHDS